VNAQMDVLLFRGRTGAFLEHASGNASLNLLKMARESLVYDLRTTVSTAIRQDTTVRHENASLRTDRQAQSIAIEVVPFKLTPAGERFFLVLFQEQTSATAQASLAQLPGPAGAKARREDQRREMIDLQQELANSKESLQAIIEEQEATNEELKSANEEIQSSN